MYLNVYVPQLQYAAGLVGFVHRQLGLPIASTSPMAPISDAFTSNWGAAVHAGGNVEPAAQAADLTGIMQPQPGRRPASDLPTCMRLIARRTPRPANKPAKLGEHSDWEYGAFVWGSNIGFRA
jgi:hypothetical protein